MNAKCAVIIVTHNSEQFLPHALETLKEQTLPPYQTIIIDSGSKNTSYLPSETILAGQDIGFCRANNVGMEHVSKDCEFALFLNPDAFLSPQFLHDAVIFMQQPENQSYAAITGTTLGYDISKHSPKEQYDTTGVFNTWYGRWYDRGQGEPYDPTRFDKQEDIPAICGAVFFCRKQALEEIYKQDRHLFDPSFFMYKEDIDLSLRLRRQGWKLAFVPHLKAYHCRGWQERTQIPRWLRLLSARNQLRVELRRHSIIGTLYSALKYTLVKLFNI